MARRSETPLLDALLTPTDPTLASEHTWSDDILPVPNAGIINMPAINDVGLNVTVVSMLDGSRFRVGDLIQSPGSTEILLVTVVAGNSVTVERAYGGTAKAELTHQLTLTILGHAAIDATDVIPATTSVVPAPVSNYTQVFLALVSVPGNSVAAVSAELSRQKALRLREMMIQLETTVISGVAKTAAPNTGRRTMRGILSIVTSHNLALAADYMPASDSLNLDHLHAGLHTVVAASHVQPDLIVMHPIQKHKLDVALALPNPLALLSTNDGYARIMSCDNVPQDAILYLNSNNMRVLPRNGQTFRFARPTVTGGQVKSLLSGEYTLEMRNEYLHAVLRGLAL